MPDLVQKPIRFFLPSDLHTAHTTHLVCAVLPGRYILTFFECLPPLVLGVTDAEKQQEWGRITEIPATAVARLIVAEVDLPNFIQVLQQQQQQVQVHKQGLQGFKAFT